MFTHISTIDALSIQAIGPSCAPDNLTDDMWALV